MEDGWYFDEDLMKLRKEMLDAHLAWKAAARRPLDDERPSRQERELEDDARRAVDAYVAHRTMLRADRLVASCVATEVQDGVDS